ncbi:MAG: hypothetical protein QF860_03625, partial [Planctomycetota bacterium]|nr:hypothetical protein [Planctomycetota bacterium]
MKLDRLAEVIAGHRALPLLVPLAAVLWSGLALCHEAAAPPDLNDSIVHAGLTRAVLGEWAEGRSGLDPWVADWAFGYPVLRHYQPASYLCTAAVTVLLPGDVDPARVLDVLTWLGLCLHPLLLYAAARWAGVDPWTAGLAGGLSCLVQSP